MLTSAYRIQMAQCFGAHALGMSRALKHAILKAGSSKKALKKAEGMLVEDCMFRALVGTTQAVDIVSGGVKSNVLPEQALALVNHRIATQSSVNATRGPAGGPRGAVQPLPAAAYGTLELSAPQTLESAPVTPSDAPPFRLLAGTIRTARQGKSGAEKEKDVFVTPGMMTGNTDTRFNWELSDHIFRYGHGNFIGGGLGGIHTVDEHIRADSFVEMITFFTTLILNGIILMGNPGFSEKPRTSEKSSKILM
ncbi:hypothetical protein DFH09DRAFT_1303286 [Mycena vulgaris]|nr:hypothetical protein DFH09DRAFT_1303286 [Mycena vulgaris]